MTQCCCDYSNNRQAKMDNKAPESGNEHEELDAALLDLDNDTPLNLTNEEKKVEAEDPAMAAKIEEEYMNLISDMKQSNFESEEGIEGLTQALGGLLKGLTDELGIDGKEGEDFKNLFEGGGEEKNMEELAGKLLEVFMKKDLLYEPLLDSRKNYEEYFKKQEGKIPQADLERYQQQYKLIIEILEVFDKTPEDKTRLMDLFERMQEYGQPPVGIVSVSLPTM